MEEKKPFTSHTDKSRIEQMKKNLYSPKGAPVQREHDRTLSRKNRPNLEKNWDHEDDIDFAMGQKTRYSMGLTTKLLIGAIGFFVVALGVSAYFFIGGANIVSSDNVSIEILGPVTIDAGEPLAMQVTIKNNNNVALEDVDLLVTYPDGTRTANNRNELLKRERAIVGDVPIGGVSRETLNSVLFGQEGESKSISVAIEYRVEGSSATFFKEKTYEPVIGASPLIVHVNTLKEITSRQEFETEIEIISNSPDVIKDVLLIADYPFGYNYLSALPQPTFDESIWSIGDLPPEGKRVITLRGTLAGEDGEERILRFKVGVENENDEKQIEATLVDSVTPIFIAKPFMAIDVGINGELGDEIVVGTGNRINVDLSWINNLPTPVTNAVIEVALRGDILDPRSIKTQRGLYDISRGTIVWDGRSLDSLRTVEPGETGAVVFEMRPLGLSSGDIADFRNPEIILDVSVSGERSGETQVQNTIGSGVTKTIKVATDLGLGTRARYTSGTTPPTVGQETTYTITWTATNTTNDVTNARVIATLPPYMRYIGNVTGGETVRYDSATGLVTWDIGTIQRGKGTLTTPRAVSFDVVLTPSIGHVGRNPSLIEQATLTGRDDFTDTTREDTKGALKVGNTNSGGTVVE